MAFGGLRGGIRFQLDNILTLKVGWLDKMFCIRGSVFFLFNVATFATYLMLCWLGIFFKLFGLRVLHLKNK